MSFYYPNLREGPLDEIRKLQTDIDHYIGRLESVPCPE